MERIKKVFLGRPNPVFSFDRKLYLSIFSFSKLKKDDAPLIVPIFACLFFACIQFKQLFLKTLEGIDVGMLSLYFVIPRLFKVLCSPEKSAFNKTKGKILFFTFDAFMRIFVLGCLFGLLAYIPTVFFQKLFHAYHPMLDTGFFYVAIYIGYFFSTKLIRKTVEFECKRVLWPNLFQKLPWYFVLWR